VLSILNDADVYNLTPNHRFPSDRGEAADSSPVLMTFDLLRAA